jgi:hypothetical protein
MQHVFTKKLLLTTHWQSFAVDVGMFMYVHLQCVRIDNKMHYLGSLVFFFF